VRGGSWEFAKPRNALPDICRIPDWETMLQPHRSAWSDCLIGLAFAFDFPTRIHLQADRENLLLLALDRASHAGWAEAELVARMLAIFSEV
jgi:hypothetical protein